MKLTTPTVAKMTGASERQLRHWAKTKLLEPSAKKTGHRLYSFHDAVAASTIVELRKKGCALQAIHRVIRRLRSELGVLTSEQFASQMLVTDGNRFYLISEQQQLVDVLTGQTVAWYVLPVGQLAGQMEQRLRGIGFEWSEIVFVKGQHCTLFVSHEPGDSAYAVRCREYPGAIEQGDTPEEAIANGKDAIESVIEFLAQRVRSRRAGARANS